MTYFLTAIVLLLWFCFWQQACVNIRRDCKQLGVSHPPWYRTVLFFLWAHYLFWPINLASRCKWKRAASTLFFISVTTYFVCSIIIATGVVGSNLCL